MSTLARRENSWMFTAGGESSRHRSKSRSPLGAIPVLGEMRGRRVCVGAITSCALLSSPLSANPVHLMSVCGISKRTQSHTQRGRKSMEDPRYQVAAIQMEDPRCQGLQNGMAIAMEDLRCERPEKRWVIRTEDPRCMQVEIVMEDSRCQWLHMNCD